MLKPPATAISAIDWTSSFSGYGVLFSIILISSTSSVTVVLTSTSSSPHAIKANSNVKTKNVKKIVFVKVKFENNLFLLI